MKNNHRLIILEIILIILLLLISAITEFRIREFKRDCVINYDINGSCPCKSTRVNYSLYREAVLDKIIQLNLSQIG
jgi:hypothetical protein